MQTHTIVSRMAADSIKVDLIYENHPVIAGTDELALLLKFRYVGELNTKKSAPKERKETVSESQEDEGNGSWFGRRISSQFSNATRALFLQQLETLDEEEASIPEKIKDVSLFLGYTQVLGAYIINPNIVDKSIFEELRKSTIFGDKIAGITGLEVDMKKKDGILSDLSHYFSSEINSMDKMQDDHSRNLIPIYSTTQSLLFSDVTFKPSQFSSSTSTSSELTRSYYVNIRLPKTLPPTYESNSITINYNFIFGYQVEENGRLINKTLFFPLKIQPYIDLHARQPVYHLQETNLNHTPKLIKNIDINVDSDQLPRALTKKPSFKSLKRHYSDSSIGDGSSRRSSVGSTFDSIDASSAAGSLSADNNKGDDAKLQVFMDFMEELNKVKPNDILKLQEKFENAFYDQTQTITARENLINIIGGMKTAEGTRMLNDTEEEEEENIDFEALLPKKPQTKFILKQNHIHIAAVNINKAVFKVGDTVCLNISFKDRELLSTGLEILLLSDEVIYRDEYLQRNEYGDPANVVKNGNHLENVVYEQLISTMCDDEINANLLIPRHVSPQFKTNFFQLKYILQIKFVLVDAYGTFKKAREKERRGESSSDSAVSPQVTSASSANSAPLEERLASASMDPSSSTPVETPKRDVYELVSIYGDVKGQVLFRGTEYIQDAMEFIVRLPIIVLPNYEQDFGSLIN